MPDFDAYEKTVYYARGGPNPDEAVLPEWIGRYRVKSLLGSGGFGLVYRASDESLQRDVAIKVPHRELVTESEGAAPYLAEARTVAALDHPHIVPVYDVGSTDAFSCYVVSKFIDGMSLSDRLLRGGISLEMALGWLIPLADALQYAHEMGVVHRDVKPGNILVDRQETPFFTDFGLALRDQDPNHVVWYAGTPPYMSPEQVRGEGHRIDGRSDLFSLGVVLYELLTGKYPFGDKRSSRVVHQISSQEPKPPRQLDDEIPEELNRICLKCLSKRINERYSSAAELRDDLQRFRERQVAFAAMTTQPMTDERGDRAAAAALDSAPPGSGSPSAVQDAPSGIVPKGIRSFDEHDSEFFLSLLPGPRDYRNLPESLRFWKNRLEARDPQKTFAVGLLYGPSGCGKSSFLKAGLLPRLSQNVEVIYVEASAHDTEASLLRALAFQCPDVAEARELREALTLLRRGLAGQDDTKYVLVLDQFEQWLHANNPQRAPLVEALRHCDGQRLTSLISIRDDFWLAVSRFFGELEIRIVEGHNSGLLDLFEEEHARRVLILFGQAYGRLPQKLSEVTAAQELFVRDAVEQMMERGKVPCIRLALFADMLRSHPWTRTTLRRIGGAAGIGVTFLEEAFSLSTAPPRHRYHATAARDVLNSLLPESAEHLRGPARSRAELQKVAGYEQRNAEFEELLAILDSELRLLTPVDSGPDDHVAAGERGGECARDDNSADDAQAFQLSHDYLIPILRDWLTRKKQETRKGRAELRLADTATWWNARPEPRRLPGWFGYLSIVAWTRSRDRTAPQQKMMAAAHRHYLKRLGMMAAVGVAILILEMMGSRWLQELDRRERAAQTVAQLWQVDSQHLPDHVQQMETLRPYWSERVEAVAHDDSVPPAKRLRALLALTPETPDELEFVRKQLVQLERDDLLSLLPATEQFGEQLVREPPGNRDVAAWAAPHERLAWAAMVARFRPQDPGWEQLHPLLVSDLLQQSPVDMVAWLPAYDQVATGFLSALKDEFASDDPDHRYWCAVLIRSLLARNPEWFPPAEVAEFVLNADARQFRALVRNLSPAVLRPLESTFRKTLAQPLPQLPDPHYLHQIHRHLNAAVALRELGDGTEVWRRLTQRTPDQRTILIHSLAELGVPWDQVLQQAEQAEHAETRQAAVLALGSYSGQLTDRDRSTIAGRLAQTDPDQQDAALRSAVLWLASQPTELGGAVQEALESAQETGRSGSHERRTFAGQRMIPIQPPDHFQIGSPSWEPGRDSAESRQTIHGLPAFEISATEVTVKQYGLFDREFRHADSITPSADCPVTKIAFYDAVRYCRWLSEKEEIPESRMCYPPLPEIGPEMVLPDDFLQRDGYRLPTVVEWECAARAGCPLSRFFGISDRYVNEFAWFAFNSEEHVWPVAQLKPNAYGVFDVYGNVFEWCHSAKPTNQRELFPIRGGAYRSTPRFLRSAMPAWQEPAVTLSTHGFRIARTHSDQQD